MARGLARALAAYVSDLLLWISIASVLEVAAVIGMALLCILSAGYFFDTMKKNPVVLVLGGIVALAGTFLMFREVRAMIFPPPAVVVMPAPAQQQPPPMPGHDAVPLPAQPSKDAAKPFDLTCTGLPKEMCRINLRCRWSAGIEACVARAPVAPVPGWNFPNPSYELTTCILMPEETCTDAKDCYWSTLFGRCERTAFTTSLGASRSPPQRCNGLAEPACKARSDCLWMLNGCMTDLLKTPAGP